MGSQCVIGSLEYRYGISYWYIAGMLQWQFELDLVCNDLFVS